MEKGPVGECGRTRVCEGSRPGARGGQTVSLPEARAREGVCQEKGGHGLWPRLDGGGQDQKEGKNIKTTPSSVRAGRPREARDAEESRASAKAMLGAKYKALKTGEQENAVSVAIADARENPRTRAKG